MQCRVARYRDTIFLVAKPDVPSILNSQRCSIVSPARGGRRARARAALNSWRMNLTRSAEAE